MGAEKEILVPDIGDFHDVEVVDVAVKPGDTVKQEDTLFTIESEKASMDIPSPAAGVVKELRVKKGDRVSMGSPVLLLVQDGAAAETPKPAPPAKAEKKPARTAKESAPAPPPAVGSAQVGAEDPAPYAVAPTPGPRSAPPAPIGSETVGGSQSARAYASPATRKFARELGIDLGLVRGGGRKGRILIEDVKSFTKAVMTDNRVFQKSGGFAMPEIPPVDFSKFGPVETRELSRLKRLSGQNLHRNWVTIPHVTQFDEADITELEEFRKSQQDQATKKNIKLTLLTFLVKAAVVALRKNPDFNSSLTPDGGALVTKQYFHIGFAVNTDQGLMVPVIRDADQKGLFDIARELAELAEKARSKKIKPAEMQGGCFTISSLGHVGGTAFTPIINAPEVAIMGVSRAAMKPVYMDGKFEPHLLLPFSVSYDHRVIDGVAAAEFAHYISTLLADIREILL